MRAVLLVPRRADGGPRDKVWAWCRAAWEALHPDLPIYEGHHNVGLFNRSAAVNRAADLADRDGRWDVGVVIDSDVFLAPGQVRAAIAIARESGHVTWAFRRWRGVTREATEKLVLPDPGYERELFGEGGISSWDDGEAARRQAIASALGSVKGIRAQTEAVLRALTGVRSGMVDTVVEKTNPLSWSCCFAIPRPGWDRLGGFDERFRGWGFEDMAFQSASVGLIGHERVEGDLFHLWHPRSPGLGQAAYGRVAEAAESIENALRGRQYMVAVRRDYGLTDRATPTDAAEMERDIANLQRDSARYTAAARQAGLGDLVGQWPTLEELVASAKEFRESGKHHPSRTPKLSVVIRTGGTADRWPQRRDYLERALTSFDEHVQPGRAEIVRRVVFSDWPAAITPELGEIAARHGFYVVGQGNLGYTPSMQKLWTYLGSRKDAFDHVFMVEDDFLFERDVDLGRMADVLDEQPHLTQVALLRDAFYPAEREKDGILGWPASSFEGQSINGDAWLEHRNFWTANPSLFRRSLTHQPWPSGKSSERLFADALFRDPGNRSAFWGAGEPWVRHLGEVRAGPQASY